MKASFATAALLLTLSSLLPFAHGHISEQVNPSSYGYNISCDKSSNLIPGTYGCLRFVSVPSGATHWHNTYVFPIGGVGKLELNIQEPLPFVGDFVTWYHYGCTALAPYSPATPATCFGGQARDWHSGVTHKWRAEGQITACVPGLCSSRIASQIH